MRIHNIVKVLLLMLLMLMVCSCAFAEEWINPAYEYYYQQLTPNQQAMYRVILDAPAETATYTVVLPEDGISREKIEEQYYIARHYLILDHPENTAWLGATDDFSYDSEVNAVTFTLSCDVLFDPVDQIMFESILDTIVAAADPSWDLYTKAVFVSNVVDDALTYDMGYTFYSDYGKAQYFNSNVYCVNNGYGICGGFSKLYKSIADRIGLPCVEVGSVSHAWVHIQMEDGNWYGEEPQDSLYLQGTSTMLGRAYANGYDIYELVNGSVGIIQPERTTYDYVYTGIMNDPGSVDLSQMRLGNADKETTFLYEVNADGQTCTITGCTGKASGDLIIPSELDDYVVTAIGNSAFAYAQFDGVLSLPDTLEEIGSQAFIYCQGLTGQLVLPANLKTIGPAAFIYCSGFTGEIVFNDKLERIGCGAFAFCDGLTGSLYFPDSIIELENYVVYECNGLDGILHIPMGISAWSASYVTLCDNLTGFDVSPDHPSYCVVNGILYNKEMNALLQCLIGHAGPVVIPEGVTKIGELAFYRCEKITSISFPSTLERIESWGCADMNGIPERLILPESLNYLADNAFLNGNAIKTLFIPADVRLDKDAFSGCQNLESVIVSEGITELPDELFSDATSLDTIYLPSTISSIGDNSLNAYGIEVNGMPGTAAETFVNSERGQQLHAVFYPIEMVNGYVLTGDFNLSLFESETSRISQLSIEPKQPTELVEWSSSNESVAIVADGLVTGVAMGQTVITATFGDTVLQCTVTVDNRVRISADYGASLMLYVGEIAELIWIEAEMWHEATVWQSSDEQVVIADERGLITAMQPGVAFICVKTQSDTTGDYMTLCRVTVKKRVLAGDADDNGVVDVHDALLVLQYSAGWDVAINVDNADYNANGTVSILDALRILEYCAGGDLTTALRALRAMSKELSINLLEIVEQPADQYVAVGKQAQFTVAATGDGLEYQWYIDRNDGNGWCKLKHAAGETYITSAVEVENYGFKYRCVITDAYGNQLMSDVAVLHVVLELPVTSDASHPVLWMALCALSLMGFTLLRTICKRAQRIC